MSYLQRRPASNLSLGTARGQPKQARLMRLFTLAALAWMCLFSPVEAQTASATASKQIKIVALGDSLTAGYGLGPEDGFVPQLQAALRAGGHQVTISNAGVSGDTSSGGLARLDWAVATDTQAVIIELGANDMLRGISPKVTEKNLRKMIEKLQARGVKILLAGMLAAPNLGPVYEQDFNRIYPQLARRYGLVYYPFFLDGVAADPSLNLSDGIHPNEQGIKIIVRKILPSVEKLLARVTS